MKTILVFAQETNPWVTNQWIKGLVRYAKTTKWRLELLVRERGVREERKRLRELIRYFKPDGIISSYTEGMAGNIPADLPIAWMDVAAKDIPKSDPLVSHDGSKSAEEAANELKRIGLRHFAAIGDTLRSSWSVERIAIFRRCVGKRIATLTPSVPVEDIWRFQRELKEWIAGLPKPCGIFAVNDRIAVNVLSALADMNVHVPKEVAVVGVDNDEVLCNLAVPPLTSVATDWEKGGFMVGEALDRRLGADPSGPMRASFGELGIVRRASSNPGVKRVDSRITEASLFIREHACEGIGVMDVVRHMGCSRRLAEVRYLQATGHSIFSEIREARFAQVLVLLARRDVAIAAVADMCGWKSAVALRLYFERRMGMSMCRWRMRGSAQN